MLTSPLVLSLEELPNEKALDDARGEIQAKLSEGGSRLAHLNWSIMRNAAGKSLREALGKLDLLDYVAGAWCTATELREMARKTLKNPGSEDTLALAEHDPSITLHPVVKICCGPVELPALTFKLELGASVECAVLVVSEGKLAGIEAGTFKPFAKLSYGPNELNKLEGDEVSITRRYKFPKGGFPIPCSAEDEAEAETPAA
jgi:hypothetical protein